MSKKIKNEQKKFLGETLNQYDKALDEAINQLDKKNREQNHKISSLVNSFDNEYLEKDVEGNMTALENSKDGMVIINEIQGNTEVNYCKDGEKELILNGDIDTQGKSFVTLTEGIDGGLVDVSLEGNTEINLSSTKDPVLVTREFDDINCNAGKLQYTIDDVTTINDEPGKVDIDRIVGDTMVNHAVNGSEELILNAHINESGDNSITLNGVTSDGGKVDVALEGNTLVNVSNVKDDYITPTIEDKIDKGSVISLPEVSEGLIHIDEIEGNTLVNYCTDGAKELTLNGDIDVEGTFVTTTEGADNGLVDVMCEGNTLVNIVTEYKLGFVNASRVDDQYVKLQHGSNENTCYITLPYGSCLYKPRTTYTLVVDIKENTSTARLGMSNIGSVISKVGSRDIGKDPGKYFITFETKDDFSTDNRGVNAPVNDIYFCSWDKGGDGSKHIIFRFFILEGDWTNKEIPQYFEGMKSVGQDDANGHKIEILSTTNNLLDLSLIDGLVEEDGKIVAKKAVMNCNTSLKLRPNTKYKVTMEKYDDNPSWIGFGYTANGVYTFIGNIGNQPNKVIEFTTPNEKDIKFYTGANAPGDIGHYLRLMKLEYANSSSNSTIAKQNKKEILLNKPLRSLPNGIKDRFVKIGGKWFIERKCGGCTFNGSETTWDKSRDNNDEVTSLYYINREDKLTRGAGLCDKFNLLPSYAPNQPEGIYFGIDINIRINKSRLSSDTIEGFVQWLQQNPVTVIYQLATPTYEPLEIEPTLNTYNDTTHISNNSVIPCNMQIKNTGYNAIIKPSTLYTVAVDTNKSGTIGMSLGGVKGTTTNNVLKLTTPATLADDSLRLYGKGIKGSKVRLLEGDKTNWIPSHFEGMKSSFEDKVQEDGSYKMEILMNNRNLFSTKDISYKGAGTNGRIDILTDELIQFTNTEKTYTQAFMVLRLKPFTTYKLSAELQLMQIHVFYGKVSGWDANKYSADINNLNSSNLILKTKEFTTDKSGIITLRTTNEQKIGTNIAKNIIVEEIDGGNYVPHKQNKIQFSSIEPLRKWDRFVFKNNQLMIERGSVQYILNGTEGWGCNDTWADEKTYTTELRTNLPYITNKHTANILSDMLPTNSSLWGCDSEGVHDVEPNKLDVRVRKSRIGLYNGETNRELIVQKWKEYLKINPLTVVHKLTEPTYEEIPFELQKIILEGYENGTLFIDTNIPPTKVSFNCFEEDLTYLYPSTSYTVQFNSDRDTTVDITLGGTSLLAQNITKGLNRINITTPATLVDNKLIIDGVGANIKEVVVTNTNREFGYFEGMKSVGECEDLEVVSSNKNLWTPDLINSDKAYEIVNGYRVYVIKAKPNTKYTFSGTGVTSIDGVNSYIWLCDSKTTNEGKFFRLYPKLTSYRTTTTVTSNSYGELYVILEGYNSLIQDVIPLLTDVQIEEGSTATDYIPHAHITQTLTHEPLRAVGDVKDRYVMIDGKWYIERNCRQENMSELKFAGDTRDTMKCLILFKSKPKAISNIFSNSRGYESATKGQMYVQERGDGMTYLWIPTDPMSRDEFTSFLNEKNATIVYAKAEPTYEPINYNPLVTYSDITHITTNSTIPTNITVKNHGYNVVALKENTQYTLYVDKNTTNALTYRLGDYVEINSLSKFTFTTPSTLTDKTLRIDSKGTKVKDLMLIEGTPANDPVGYFDGLKSSYECEQVTDENNENYGKYKVDIKVVGKNLFNHSLVKGYFEESTGNPLDWMEYVRCDDFIPCRSNTQYTSKFLYGSNIKYFRIYFYDANKNFITSVYPNGTSPFNAHYMRLGSYCEKSFTLVDFTKIKDVQLEEGDTATEYEPYFESKQTIYLNSPLLKGDEIVWKDNKIQHYHKMNKVVLDGSDDEIINLNADRGNLIEFMVSEPLIPNRAEVKYVATTLPNVEGLVEKIVCGYQVVYIQLQKARLQSADISGFKQWLQANPVTVVHELKTPYYEEISDYPLKLNVIANSSLSTESTIQVTNISFNIYEETLAYLYPSTKYYISFNADVDRNNIIINLGGSHTVLDCKVGFNKVEITTPSDTTNLLTFSGQGINIDHVMVTRQDIDEYFEGMKSVGECENNTLEIICKNNDNSKSNTQTLTHEPLRAVGDIKDKYVLIDGKWYIERNCSEIVLDGSEDEAWSRYEPQDTEYLQCMRYQLPTNNMYPSGTCVIGDLYKTGSYWNSTEEVLSRDTNSRIFIKIMKSKLISLDTPGFRTYLQSNPLKVIYQLATPEYELIGYNPFEVYSEVTHISSNSLIPSNMVIKNHGYNTILKPSTKYTIALNKPNGTISAKLGGSVKVDSTNSIFTITTPSTLNDNVLRLSGSGNVKDIMILEGDKTVNTPSYFKGIESVFEQEYDAEKGKYRVTARVEGDGKESSIIFYIDEPLRGTGDVKDRVYIKDDKVVVKRSCGSVTFDGSEEGWGRQEDKDKFIKFSKEFMDFKYHPGNSHKLYCNTLSTNTNLVETELEQLTLYCHNENTKELRFNLSKAKLSQLNIEGFKQWLQQNPTTVVYELQEPTYEEADCDLSKLVLENYENSSLIFESNIPVSANIRYSGEVPVVTQAKSLSSQVDNTTLDINENIIPYMCDIDYRIVELQLMNGDAQGEGIELLGIGDIEILGNENVLFNNREDKKHNFSYDMLKRDILSKRYSKEEYQYRLDRYLLANKISNEEYKELEGLLNNGE